jgi:hypothetical protein
MSQVNKINFTQIFRFLGPTGAALRAQKGKLGWAQWRDVITCLNSVKIGPSGFKSVELGVDRKFVRLWKALGMAKLRYAENWSFQGLSEANWCDFLPRAFTPKLAKSAQGFPNLDNNSQGLHLHSFNSPWQFTFSLHSLFKYLCSTIQNNKIYFLC